MKDKIIQMTAVQDHIVVLTQMGRILDKSPSGKWVEKTPPKSLMEFEDVPRFWFGKHKGEPIQEADPTYIRWCQKNIDDFGWTVNGNDEIVKSTGLFEEDDIPF